MRNATERGSAQQIAALVAYGCVQQLCALLTPALKFSAEDVLHAIVYTELAGNVGLPAVMLLIWLGTSVKLAGFPLKNERAAERLACVNRNAVVWTVGRMLYGALLLAVVST